jgi:23S rRNA pseudouridine2605 synthase
MHLNKYLALCGVASRRKAVDLIREGRVRVNGETVRKPEHRVRPGSDRVGLNGADLRPPKRFRYVLINKPAGVLTTVSDERGRHSVLDLVPEPRGLFPVGRLDKDTEGVLLLTNDGDLAFRLTHPRYGVEKVYDAWVSGMFDARSVRRLAHGVRIEGGAVVCGHARVLHARPAQSRVRIRIHEGRKRQVRCMLQTVGYPVLRLERVDFAGLTVRGLKRGAWRPLKSNEVGALYRQVGLA